MKPQNVHHLLESVIQTLQIIQKDIHKAEASNFDVCIAEEINGLVDIWKMRRSEVNGVTTVSKTLASEPSISEVQPATKDTSSTPQIHLLDENPISRPTKAQMEERKLLERRLAHMTGTILFMASQENPQLPLNHPSQPSFIPIQKAALHRISLMFSELIEKNQDGLIDDEEIVVYDPTLASSTHKKFVQDQIIYVDGLINSFYSQGQDGHDDLVALSDDRIWKAFESILKFAKWGNFGENSVTTSRQRDLHTLCFYLDVSDDFKADLDRVCMGERDFETDMD